MNEIYTVMSNWGGIGDELLNLKPCNTIKFNKLWLDKYENYKSDL